MTELTHINVKEQLYVISEGSGYSCRGWKSLDDEARGVARWLIEKEVQGIQAVLHDHVSDLGGVAHYESCLRLIKHGAEYAQASGERCPVLLVPALVGFEGQRVEITYFGERKRFRVGRSTGWMPVHLMMRTGAHGGEALSASGVTGGVVVLHAKERKIVVGKPRNRRKAPAVNETPWRCVTCGTPVRLNHGDPCKCDGWRGRPGSPVTTTPTSS